MDEDFNEGWTYVDLVMDNGTLVRTFEDEDNEDSDGGTDVYYYEGKTVLIEGDFGGTVGAVWVKDGQFEDLDVLKDVDGEWLEANGWTFVEV